MVIVGENMSWIGIVSIDGELIAEKAVRSEEEAKQNAERLLERILMSERDVHGFSHFRARAVNWANGWMSEEKSYLVNLSRICSITTKTGRSNRPSG